MSPLSFMRLDKTGVGLLQGPLFRPFHSSSTAMSFPILPLNELFGPACTLLASSANPLPSSRISYPLQAICSGHDTDGRISISSLRVCVPLDACLMASLSYHSRKISTFHPSARSSCYLYSMPSLRCNNEPETLTLTRHDALGFMDCNIGSIKDLGTSRRT